MNLRAPDTLERPDEWIGSSIPRPCRDDPERWFSSSSRDQRLAVQRCKACPLLTPCREYALSLPQLYGVWGGLTETGRRKARKNAENSPCGTSAAYRRHLANKETCTTCAAWRADEVERSRRERLAEEHALGGTRTGARIHQRLGEPVCHRCSAATARDRAAEWAQRPRKKRTRPKAA